MLSVCDSHSDVVSGFALFGWPRTNRTYSVLEATSRAKNKYKRERMTSSRFRLQISCTRSSFCRHKRNAMNRVAFSFFSQHTITACNRVKKQPRDCMNTSLRPPYGIMPMAMAAINHVHDCCSPRVGAPPDSTMQDPKSLCWATSVRRTHKAYRLLELD